MSAPNVLPVVDGRRIVAAFSHGGGGPGATVFCDDGSVWYSWNPALEGFHECAAIPGSSRDLQRKASASLSEP